MLSPERELRKSRAWTHHVQFQGTWRSQFSWLDLRDFSDRDDVLDAHCLPFLGTHTLTEVHMAYVAAQRRFGENPNGDSHGVDNCWHNEISKSDQNGGPDPNDFESERSNCGTIPRRSP
jgi:hypothetical protein